MKGFKLYFYQNNSPILFSFYDKDNQNDFTFDENLEKELNDKYTLTFSIFKKTGLAGVNLYDFLKIGRRIRLEYDEHSGEDQYVDFIITSISPVRTSDNISYNFTCEDYVSFKFARNNIGLNLNTFEDEEWIDYLNGNIALLNDNNEKVPNILTLGNYILERGTLRSNGSGWTVTCDEESEKISFNIELSDSNTYNALVEISNLTHTNFFINYKNKTIDFRYKGSPEFYKNYVLSPELNLQDASFNYDGNDFYSILYVSGSDNEYDVDVGLTPTLTNEFFDWAKENTTDMTLENYWNENFYDEFLLKFDRNTEEGLKKYNELKIINQIPYLDNFIFDFNYFQEAGLLTNSGYRDLIETKILNELRKINIDYQYLYQITENLNDNIKNKLTSIKNLSELLAPASGINIKEYNTSINNLFITKSKEKLKKIEVEDDQVNTTITEYLIDTNPDKWVNIVSVGFPASVNFDFIISGQPVFLDDIYIYNKNYFSYEYESYLGIEGRFDFKLSVNEDRQIVLEEATFYKKEEETSLKWVPIAPNVATIVVNEKSELSGAPINTIAFVKRENQFYQYMQIIEKTLNRDVNFTKNSVNFTVNTFSIEVIEEDSKTTYELFKDISFYRGTDSIINFYLNNIKNEIIENIQWRNDIINEIGKVNIKIKELEETRPKPENYNDLKTSLDQEKAGLESSLDILELEIGSWDYKKNNNDITMNSTIEEHGFMKSVFKENEAETVWIEKEGRLTTFFRKFVENLITYSQNTPIDITYEQSFYKQLQDKLRAKQEFWFNLKEEYGDVLIEGFYHNDLESKPQKLLEYADLYFRTYRRPKDDYSIEYLDASDVLGTEIKNIDVGDYISISKQDIDFVDKLSQDLRVASISRNLRSSANISLTVDKIQKTQLLLEKMIMQSYK